MRELTSEQLAAKVAQAPVLRRAPGLRDEIVAALERVQELERENRELNEQLDMSAGHTAEECEADAIQAEYETLQRHAERVEAALRTIAEGVLPGGDVKVLVPGHVQAFARAALAALDEAGGG